MSDNLSAKINPPAAVVRQEFGAQQIATVQETASVAAAAQAKASVEAAYVMALQRPRDVDEVRVRLMRECTRPGFAKSARYHKPIGEGVDGLSIRFAEAALSLWGNVLIQQRIMYNDAEHRILRVEITDLERNTSYHGEKFMEKTVERSSLRKDEIALSVRVNSKGKSTYTVRATEDDLINKEAAIVSKMVRMLGLRLIPGDIKAECEKAVVETCKNETAKDPDAEKRRVIDAFAAIGVSPSDLKDYLNHSVDRVVPAELDEMRSLYTAIHDGEATWEDAISLKREQRGEAPSSGTDTPAADDKKPALAKLTEKLQAAKNGKAEEAAKSHATDVTNYDAEPPEQAGPQGSLPGMPPPSAPTVKEIQLLCKDLWAAKDIEKNLGALTNGRPLKDLSDAERSALYNKIEGFGK